MTVNAKDLPTNNLYINEIEQNTLPNSLELGSGKESEYTYSKTLAKLLRRFVRVAVPDQDQVYYSDIEMLDTLMLCGSITGTAEKCNLSASYVSTRITAILKQLDQRGVWMGNHAGHLRRRETNHRYGRLSGETETAQGRTAIPNQ